jgi:hypothetical protein
MMHHDADVPTIAPDGPPKFSCCCNGLAALRARYRYHMMDYVLETGWTPERADPFYGGMSESEMRSMVAYARRHGFLKLRSIEKV